MMRDRGMVVAFLTSKANGIPLNDDSFEAQLPDDLNSIADALRDNRMPADGETLERVRQRACATARPPQRRMFRRPQTAGILAVAVSLAIAAAVSHVPVASAIATLASGVTSPVSNTPNNSAAGLVYCGSAFSQGSSGWAPTFRWHYGYPAPNTMGADDGWSASVQPSCPSGTLSIRWADGNVSVLPGNPIQFGYDFHQANKPAFTMTAYNLQVNWTYKCSSNGATMTYAPTNEIWSQNTYHAPANMPSWIPTGVKTDPSGFQGTMTVPALCGAGKPVIFTGGTFSAVIKIT
jgi:hypothetical protein